MPDDNSLEKLDALYKILPRMSTILDEKEYAYITAFFGLETGCTSSYKDIAAANDTTAYYVQKTVQSGLKKLKKEMRKEI